MTSLARRGRCRPHHLPALRLVGPEMPGRDDLAPCPAPEDTRDFGPAPLPSAEDERLARELAEREELLAWEAHLDELAERARLTAAWAGWIPAGIDYAELVEAGLVARPPLWD